MMINAKEEDIKKIVDLTTDYTNKFIRIIDPRDYANDVNSFINICLISPSIISGTIIHKLSETFKVDKTLVYEAFLGKVQKHIAALENKKNEPELS